MASGANPAGGGNPGGFNVNQLAPVVGPGSQMGLPGGSQNPLMAPFPAGQSYPGIESPYAAAPLPGGLGQSATGPGGVNATPGLYAGHANDIARGLIDSGMPSNLASSLAAFLKGGAGYNPQVLQSIFASLQPQVARGEADIMEHFGAEGMGMSSPAAIGMGDYLSQVNLNEGQIASQLYEQSVQNYLQVLLGGSNNKSQSGPGFWQGFGENLLSTAAKAGMSYLTGGMSAAVPSSSATTP